MLAGVSILLLVVALMQAASAFADAAPMRIASLNMCTDQLLLALADPEQIAGLSPYARDRDRSFMATAAGRFPVLSGGAEDVLVLAPGLVLAGRYTRRATREFLRAKGLPLVEFDVARSIGDAKEQNSANGESCGPPRPGRSRGFPNRCGDRANPRGSAANAGTASSPCGFAPGMGVRR